MKTLLQMESVSSSLSSSFQILQGSLLVMF